jgi:1-deoxy-D-xylulose-5-phosphate reductoisomerase
VANSSTTSRKRIVLLGATGSIGDNTLRVIAAHPDRLELVGIAARQDRVKLAGIAKKFRVPHVALFDEDAGMAAKASGDFAPGTKFHSGMAGLIELAQLAEADIVLVAVVGTTALEPTLAAIAAKKTIALASKEILVLAGKFVMAAAKEHGVQLRPVDSEHDAVSQCIDGQPHKGVRRIMLTASGGAFRDWPVERLAHVTPADALKHPNWSMGPKITVDSATLANKGLELIEAQCLFGLKPEQCDAVLHSPSIVHCLVEYKDGAMLAQMCPPSMTFAIQHALLYPDRVNGVEAALDFTKTLSLDFQPVDLVRFPMLRLAKETMVTGGCAPAVFNAANEVAVAAFLAKQIPFLAIPSVVDSTLQLINHQEPADLSTVLRCDGEARRIAQTQLLQFKF